MSGVTEENVLEALKAVKDPERGEDVVSLGMISGLVVKDGNVGFAIEVDPERGAAMEPVRKQAEAAVDAMDGVLSVTAVLTAHRENACRRRPGLPARSSRHNTATDTADKARRRPSSSSPASKPSSPSPPAKAASASPRHPQTSPSASPPPVCRSASWIAISTAPPCRA